MLFHTFTYLLPVEHQDLMLGTFLSVDIFFLLSGFLITSLLVEERARTGATSLRGFYGRRALRLLPALGALLIGRSEEHTYELQSLMRISYAVFCLKKKQNTTYKTKF